MLWNRSTMFIMAMLCAVGGWPVSPVAEPRRLPDGLAFTLTDQNGAAFTEVELKAKPSVIHFGFTSCPVICPTTLYEAAGRLRDLGDDADRINFIFVTIDPARDPPAHLKSYVGSFDSRIVGLSGEARSIATLAAAVGAQYARIESANGDYTMEHSVNAFIIDKQGLISELYMAADSRQAVVMRELRALVSGESRGTGVASVNPEAK